MDHGELNDAISSVLWLKEWEEFFIQQLFSIDDDILTSLFPEQVAHHHRIDEVLYEQLSSFFFFYVYLGVNCFIECFLGFISKAFLHAFELHTQVEELIWHLLPLPEIPHREHFLEVLAIFGVDLHLRQSVPIYLFHEKIVSRAQYRSVFVRVEHLGVLRLKPTELSLNEQLICCIDCCEIVFFASENWL